MKKQKSDFNVALPLSVNADHQTVEIFHGDPLGSYSGKPDDPFELPVQDADDL